MKFESKYDIGQELYIASCELGNTSILNQTIKGIYYNGRYISYAANSEISVRWSRYREDDINKKDGHVFDSLELAQARCDELNKEAGG